MTRKLESHVATRVLRVRGSGGGTFEVRDDNGTLLDTADNEVKAVIDAMRHADLLEQQGYRVRVMVKRDGDFVEAYAVPRTL